MLYHETNNRHVVFNELIVQAFILVYKNTVNDNTVEYDIICIR